MDLYGAAIVENFEIAISKQVGALEQTVNSAHKRVDQMNRDIKEVLNTLSAEVKKLNDHMVRTEEHGPQIKILMDSHQQRKGANAVLVLLGTLLGSAVTAGIGYFFK